MKKRTKWTIRIATVALALVALFALTGCRVSDMLSGSDVNTISGTYKVSAGDLATNGSDTDVAQNVANDMLIATLELRAVRIRTRAPAPRGRALSSLRTATS